MHIWRISRYLTLEGRGGLAASGRWHTRPQAVLYCSEDIETAIAEIEKQFQRVPNRMLIPDDFKLLKIDCGPAARTENVNLSQLHPDWSSDITGPQICRPIGDEWLSSGRTELLKVPSAARSGSFNYLFNPNAFYFDQVTLKEILDLPSA